MKKVNIYEAKTRLSQLVEAAAAGNDVVIARAGRPVAGLVPVTTARRMDLILGIDKGCISSTRDFTAPLPEDVLAAFEGAPEDPA